MVRAPRRRQECQIHFGQFLIEQGIIDQNTLFSALSLQNQEELSEGHHRRLGKILLENFRVFSNWDQLKTSLRNHWRINTRASD